MTVLILRSYLKKGTNGELFLNGKKICDTIELPWRDNKRRISCIPEGTYTLVKRTTERYGRHLHVQNVANRDWILIHAFNHALNESQGCIGPVERILGEGEGYPSRPALNRLLKLLEPAFASKQTVFLTIKKKNNEKLNNAESAKAHAEVL